MKVEKLVRPPFEVAIDLGRRAEQLLRQDLLSPANDLLVLADFYLQCSRLSDPLDTAVKKNQKQTRLNPEHRPLFGLAIRLGQATLKNLVADTSRQAKAICQLRLATHFLHCARLGEPTQDENEFDQLEAFLKRQLTRCQESSPNQQNP
ncbi:hypothetical protein KKF05_01325 [Patescibacteria group bacterium]|nr:hypothetical protein [Patescibacteria group bacterium]MBU1028914.1 hypothetical protein [Patescibacteria group bacterium]MBU1916149.1 hypothetical protein [Patescibacteria group bacterium]